VLFFSDIKIDLKTFYFFWIRSYFVYFHPICNRQRISF